MATPAVTHAAPKGPLFPVVVIGTRAQLVKMAPVLRELEARNIEFRLVLTGQHFETMQDLLDDFSVRTEPIWLGQQREIDSMKKMLLWLPRALWRLSVARRTLLRGRRGNRSLIIVHGDTVSTLLGAIAGRVNRCRVAHVESGLRSFSIREPFPEELTRLLVFRLIHVAFCPGPWATKNMAGYRVTAVDTSANTLLDAVRYAVGAEPTQVRKYRKRKSCVVSIHRHENLSSRARLTWILNTVYDIARSHEVFFVLHPSTMTRLAKSGHLNTLAKEPGIRLRNRMGYLAFMQLLAAARFVLTDGGSNQEELSYLGIPTLIPRERSERLEGLGVNAELISFRNGPDWRDQLTSIETRLANPLFTEGDHRPSRSIVDWIEANSAKTARG